MAQAKSWDFLKELIRKNEIRYYTIYDETKKSVIFSNEGNPGTPDEVIADLDAVLPNMTGLIYVSLATVSKASKGEGGNIRNSTFTIPIRLTENSAPIAGIPNQPTNTFNPEMYTALRAEIRSELEKEYNAKIEALKKEHENEKRFSALEAKLKEAEENTPLKGLEPFFPIVMNALTGAQVPVSGQPQQQPIQRQPTDINGTGEDATPEELERIEQAMSKWIQADADAISLLEKIATMAEEGSSKYQLAKTFL